MGLKNSIYAAVELCKPLLIKLIPPQILRKVKQKIIRRNFIIACNQIDHVFRRDSFDDGINLIGSIRAQHGLGQSCRLLAAELEYSCLEYGIYDFVLSNGMVQMADTVFDNKISRNLRYNINIIHINPYEFCYSYFRVDKRMWENRYNIGFWLWELEYFPEEWGLAFKGVQEIWTPSEYISNNLRKVTALPVKTMPYCVTAPFNDKYDRKYFALPDNCFLFLIMYDSNSTMERKNPLGAVEAFKQAFKKDNIGVGLVIKINNCKEKDKIVLKEALEGYSNIYFLTENLQKIQVNSLIKCVNVFVSLHRAEGFGLVMAESMLLGTAVIATDYSANTEFMNGEAACMVEYQLTSVKEKNPIYPIGAKWAEPNVSEAAAYMKKLYEDPQFYKTKIEKAKILIKEKLGMDLASRKIEQRIQEIYSRED